MSEPIASPGRVIRMYGNSSVEDLEYSIEMCMVTLRARLRITYNETTETLASVSVKVNGVDSKDSPVEVQRSIVNHIVTVIFLWTGYGYTCLSPSSDFTVTAEATLQTSSIAAGSDSVTVDCPDCP